MTASERWDLAAETWVELVRSGGDAPYAWNAPAFHELLPAPGRLTVDLGCGEGRVSRDLAARGHRVVAIDASATLIAHAREADAVGDYRHADAAALPLSDAAADLVVAFMSLHDIAHADAAIAEAARVLERGGRFCFAVLHPVATAGDFHDGDAARFVFERPYFEPVAIDRPLGDSSITHFHRPLEWYARALEAAGFLVEALREVPTRRSAPGWVPMFLHLRAVKA